MIVFPLCRAMMPGKKKLVKSVMNGVLSMENTVFSLLYQIMYRSYSVICQHGYIELILSCIKTNCFPSYFNCIMKKIFENAIPHDTALEWNDRMRGTAGFCYCKKITKRTGTIERKARIALSTKVIDSAYRLRDTLIHEMCHAATWIVNCVSDGHGPYWKAWAYKAMKIFPELPPIKRCHDYAINYKYTYRCTSCGYSIGRHSKSLNIERKRCGYCYGKFEILLNKVNKKGEAKSVPATPKKEASGFALFVKENYSAHKQPHLKHGDVMKLLGQKFQEMKLKPKPS
ncbi:hypothetical protein NQ315_004827 [Exocentrus adspersus]|uniref:SprT-like domain-containing protein n=1 Tax=Exocentrus adspersus TaxID=1586481 RepID=A0AAV8W2N1_9CUCU|nr:hypothetical protein NQ315_004827 [Exocentrus adspersus]